MRYGWRYSLWRSGTRAPSQNYSSSRGIRLQMYPTDSTNPGGVTVFRCAKRATAGVVVAWRLPKKLWIAFCRHESLMTLDVVVPSKAPRGFTASISLPSALAMLRIKHQAQGQEAVILLGFTERSAPMVTAAMDRCTLKGSQVEGILKLYPETRISARVRETNGSIFTCRAYDDDER
ncbi:hypothetical protein ARMSODRAFT_806510 [Armillaria solidipes]|uniref:Uncharacterized protein n=1 Tax=Armillaria solidipes TaxID=1076256 RepID=A0A2H3B5S6_9AGAR|nr:hypothetical protein ARMSODRAFT_806510 [Armillaria solidipes]